METPKVNITDPAYWKARIDNCITHNKPIHISVYDVPVERFDAIRMVHKEILWTFIKDDDAILDAGCAYARLLGMMPPKWVGRYAGVDLSPDFIDIAKRTYRENHRRHFYVHDLRRLDTLAPLIGSRWDWALVVSVENMVRSSLGEGDWALVLKHLRRLCKWVMVLSYTDEEAFQIIRGER